MVSAVSTPQQVPRTVRAAGALVGVQGLCGLAFVVSVFVGGTQPMSNRLGEAGYFVLLSAGVLAVAIGLLRGARWARTPAAVVQVLLIGVAYYALHSASRPEIGLPVAAYCVAVVVLLFTKRARDWAWRDRDSTGDSTGDEDTDGEDSG